MQKKTLLSIIGISLGIIVLMIGNNLVFGMRSALTSNVEATADVPRNFFANLFSGDALSWERSHLIEENATLKARVLELSKAPYVATEGKREYSVAKVYSTYPFNNRGLVTLNVGTEEGIAVGMPVFMGTSIFFGQIVEVFPRYSVARTIFDPGWQIPVKVGKDGFDALMVAGRDPRLTMIVKEKKIQEGDEIYSAGKDFPYGIKIGDVLQVIARQGDTFEQARIRLPYGDAQIDEVYILTK